MSGGSYSYLFLKEENELFDDNTLSNIDNMASRLIELGYKDAGSETLKLKYIIEQSLVRTQVLKERLEGVWKSVEWYDSADSGIEQVDDEIRKYRGES